MNDKLPVVLISGFLGSGKTTLLKEVHQQNKGHRLVYLINDFSAKEVDAHTFSESNADIISVPGGSIFCTCLVTEFVIKLNEILLRQANTNQFYEGVIIEASGTANPAVIDTLLKDSRLDRSFEIRSKICVTDPVTLPKLLQTLPNIRQQIACADRIILNKTDLVTEEELRQVENQIQEINNSVLPEKTTFCRIILKLSEQTTSFIKYGGESAHPPHTEYAKFSLQSRKPFDPEGLHELIAHYGAQIYRIKGFVFDDCENLIYVDYSVSSGLRTSRAAVQTEPHIEFIFDPAAAPDILPSIRKL